MESEVRKRAQLETEQQRMADILRYMQTLGAATGVAPLASLFNPPRPPGDVFSTPVSPVVF